MADIQSASWSETDASNNSAPPAGFPEGQLPSTVNDSARAVMGAIRRFYDHINPIIVSQGSANAQTLTYAVAPAAYVTGDRYTFIVGSALTNTGATTLNVNGLGAKNILIGSNALQGRELRESQVIDVSYDGTQFQLLRGIVPAAAGFIPNNPTGVSGAAVMMGIGSTCTITPKVSGEIQISLTGDLGTGTSSGTIFRAQLRYGTGTAPANGTAVSGTAVGSELNFTVTAYTSGDRFPFSLFGHVTGLTIGTAYWIDISLSCSTGTGTSQNLSMLVRESPR